MIIGGPVKPGTVWLLAGNDVRRELIGAMEICKCVVPVGKFLEAGALEDAFAIECALLDSRSAAHGAGAKFACSRAKALRSRN